MRSPMSMALAWKTRITPCRSLPGYDLSAHAERMASGELTRPEKGSDMSTVSHKVVVIGRGARAGIATAASIATTPPRARHRDRRTVRYPHAATSPAGRWWAAGGIRSRHPPCARWPAPPPSCPKGATWIRQAAAQVSTPDEIRSRSPMAKRLDLTNVLIVAPGIPAGVGKDRGGLEAATWAQRRYLQLPPRFLRPTHGEHAKGDIGEGDLPPSR